MTFVLISSKVHENKFMLYFFLLNNYNMRIKLPTIWISDKSKLQQTFKFVFIRALELLENTNKSLNY